MKPLLHFIIYALCAAILVVSKEMLAFLPNVELVSFFIILFALTFTLEGTIFITMVFCLLQMVLYGVGLWTPIYFIVWPMLAIITNRLRFFLKDYHRCAILSGLFGLVFGFLFSIPYFVISFEMGWIYFIKGIPFDLIHGIANYVIMALLFDKMIKVMVRLQKQYPGI